VGSSVVFTISDDGRGVDPARVRAAAVARGRLRPAEAEALSDADALELLFEHGFSTRLEAGQVSGRGGGPAVGVSGAGGGGRARGVAPWAPLRPRRAAATLWSARARDAGGGAARLARGHGGPAGPRRAPHPRAPAGGAVAAQAARAGRRRLGGDPRSRGPDPA